MAVNEHSLGGLFFGRYKLPRRWCRPFVCDMTEMVGPWRTGSAWAFPSGPFRSTLLIGIWKEKLAEEDYNEDLEDEQWLGGRFLDSVSVEEISNWSAGPDEAEEQKEAAFDSDPAPAPAPG